MVRFSDRLPGDLAPNALARVREGLAAVPFDLTVSNPTRCALPYPVGLLEALARDAGLDYRPDPAGLLEARRTIALDYARRGVEVDPARVILAASTSEAYAFLFKLLGDPGDGVLIPAPSYPLLQHLATLEGLRALPYRLDAHGGWQPDPRAVEGAGARAVVVVHPNNPTGSYVARPVAAELLESCSRTGTALIADEVFYDFPLGERGDVASFATEARALTFTLGGLSKQLGLPQLKLSWIVVGGGEEDAAQAVARLSFIADQYLSVSTPVQLALEDLLLGASSVHAAIHERCRRNLDALSRAVARAAGGVTLLRPAGGWSAVLRYPAVVDEETLALELLREDGVAVHPGYFFDFPAEGYLVLSLLPEAGAFDEGLARLLRRLEGLDAPREA